MKKSFFILTALFAFCTTIFAGTVPNIIGDKVEYEMNRGRTSWIIRSGKGSLTVMSHRATGEHGPGYVVKMEYALDVIMRGEQKGDIGLFIPEKIFEETFLHELAAAKKMSFGSFDITYSGQGRATTAHGMSYDCFKARVNNIKPDHKLSLRGVEAELSWINHHGSIKWVKDLELNISFNNQVPVIGAVQLDIKGTTNNGITFEGGLDAKFPPR